MAYFPESHAGDYWNQALTNIGQNIAQSMEFYRKRHDELTQMDATLEGLTQIPDVTGKPILDPKAYERIRSHTDKERYGLEKGTLQALDIGTQLQKAHADVNRLILSDRFAGTGRYLYNAQGEPYAQWNQRTQTWVKMPQQTKEPVEASEKALESHANKTLATWGMNRDDFWKRTNEETGHAPPVAGGKPGELDLSKPENFLSGSEAAKQKTDAGEQNAVRFKVNGTTKIVSKSDFDIVRKIHPRKGDPGYQEPVKVGQPQGSAVKYPVGTRARSGNVWHTMTDQGWDPPLQPRSQQGTAEIGAGEEEDAGEQ